MNKLPVALLCPALLLACSKEEIKPTQPMQATADVLNADGVVVGKVLIKESEGEVQLLAKFRGLPPGPHGFHIHDVGSCEPPDFSSAEGHFNPEGMEHGKMNPEGSHAGDMANLMISEKGTAKIKIKLEGVTLAEGNNSLLEGDSTALVVHADPDDEKTDPAGNAGPRIACGVISR